MTAVIFDLEFFMVYCILLVKPFHLIPISRRLKKICNPPFCDGGHLVFGIFHGVLYFTSQALSFDTHIEGVEKKICNPSFCGGGHLGFTIILNIHNCIEIPIHMNDFT